MSGLPSAPAVYGGRHSACATRNRSTRRTSPTRRRRLIPQNFPEKVRENALADFGPNLSNIAAKFAGKPEGHKWLSNWIQSPERYHPKSLMPNLQLTPQDAADIASWLLSVPGEWPVTMEVLPLESKEVKTAIDDW